ncbi:MAG: poly-beta-hydroxybutyrate polymerase, partial [Gammaproteobacteria bacterium]
MSSQSDIDDKIQNAVEKVLSRNIDGLKHLDGLALDLGVTPKDIIYSRGSMKLYHYHPVCDEIYRVPIVLVMSLINRYYIVDLAPGQSFVEYLVAQGFDVYLIDWGLPRQEHKHFTFDDYVDDFLPDCLDKVAEDCGEDQVSLIGYCLGGVIASLYTALHPDK